LTDTKEVPFQSSSKNNLLNCFSTKTNTNDPTTHVLNFLEKQRLKLAATRTTKMAKYILFLKKT